MTNRWRLALTLAMLATVSASAAAQSSWGVAVTTGRDVVFCDVRRDKVWKLDRSGNLSVLMEDTHCRGLVLGQDGFVYGESVSVGTHVDASTGAARDNTVGIWRLGGGSMMWIEPPTTRPDPAIGLAVGPDGHMYGWNGMLPRSSVSQVVRRDPAGLTLPVAGQVWGQRDGLGDQARFGRVAGLALAPDGTLLVADSGNLRRVGPLGQVRTESVGSISDTDAGVSGHLGLWDRTMGVVAATDSSAIVVDYPARRIAQIAPGGRAREIWRSGGWANALTGGRWGWRPTGVALLQSGFYVMEDWAMPPLAADLIGVPRVLVVRADGSTERVVSVFSWFVRAFVALTVVIMLSAQRARRGRKQGGRPDVSTYGGRAGSTR